MRAEDESFANVIEGDLQSPFPGLVRQRFNASGGNDEACPKAFRLNAAYENLDNHRDFGGGERLAVNPYLAIDLGRSRLGLSYGYVNDDPVTDRGIPSVATVASQPNCPIAGQRDRSFGVPGVNRTGLEAHFAKARLDGELAVAIWNRFDVSR